MSLMIAGIGALGLTLIVTSLPVFNRLRLRDRVDPYLSGLKGRPSALLSLQPGTGLRARLGALARTALPTSNEDLPARLVAAGRNSDAAAFRLEQVIWALASVLVVWVVALCVSALGGNVDARSLPLVSLLALVTGFFGRDWWLGRQLESRRASLVEELPTAIDLVTLAIMSGESVPASFARVGGLLGSGIGAEFENVVADIRAGAPAVDSLEDMKRRLPAPGVGRFIDALITAIERGAPLADVLRAQADDGREARRRHLLEAGGRREVLMLVPVVFLIMPVVIVFSLLPGLVSLDLLVP